MVVALVISLILLSEATYAQTTNVVILDSGEIKNLRRVILQNERAKQLYDSVASLARAHSKEAPRPLKRLYYEGLLETNPDRVDTRKSLQDMDKVISFIYASYGSNDTIFARKTKQFVLAWANAYQPTGNPINENKFVALYWGYYLFQDHFSDREQERVEQWMMAIAEQEMNRQHTHNNNWEAKRQKMIGIIGIVTGNDSLKAFAQRGFRAYINTAYFPDSTSTDLRQRDALHYHVGGLKPMLSAAINLSKFDTLFSLYDYVAPSGASVEKSVAYVVPYARGELERAEWVNTTVALDKERAAAGLAEYQPGILFDPEEAVPLFEWAVYYQPAWFDIVGDQGFVSTWVSLLNSPLVRPPLVRN
ncbi:MAG: alginate lyase family protein [Tunicatimonas sp.]